MVKVFNMKDELNLILDIINDYKSKSNKDLTKAMDFIKKDFDITKENLLRLEQHLTKLESTYNTLLKEYQKRTNG
jgi:prefoldin subunit 5